MAQRRKGRRKVSAAEQARRDAARKERVQGLFDKLEDGLEDYMTSDGWKSFLRAQAAFISRYSWRNTLLIKLQKPGASLVMGYRKWQDHGRHVKPRPEDVPKGEYGITILAPMRWSRKVKDESTGEETRIGGIRGFKTETVFDISQTDILPGCEETAIMPLERCGDFHGDDAGLWTRLLEFAEHKGIPVSRSDDKEAYYLPREHRVVIGRYPSKAMEAMALAHELGHALFRHGGADCKLSRNVKELEAQSVAYIVCAHFGIDADQFTFKYLSGWTRQDTLKVLQTSGKRIRDLARAICEYTEVADAKGESAEALAA